jgi:hypothetical protein
MKNMVLFVILILAVLLVASCGSCTSAESASSPVPESAHLSQLYPQPQYQIIDVARHSSNIILDGAVNYTVRSGDILTEIARNFYQDGSYYPLIMMVCDDIVIDPDKIEPGMILTIPDLNRNIADTKAKYSMNSFFARIADIEEQRGRYNTAVLIRNHTS